jgi:guanine nucleotide-binding protein alpha-1 subunit
MVQLISDHFDPLSSAIAPSEDETLEQRTARLKAEEQAKKLSDDIDKFLKYGNSMQEGHRKKPTAVKVLLLGQSECGKSTALKSTSAFPQFDNSK